jgi:hypothetical protein
MFFWGDALLNKNYSFTNDKQNYTDKNFEVKDSILRIVTRKEKSEGLGWDSKFGLFLKHTTTPRVLLIPVIFKIDQRQVEAKVRLSCCPELPIPFTLLEILCYLKLIFF